MVFTVSWSKNSKTFPSRAFLLRFWWNVYWSVLVPRNLPCLEKLLVARLYEEMTLKSMPQTKVKYDSLVLSRSYLWMVWRWHGIPLVHCYYFCLEPTVRKDTWMRTISVTVMVILFESSILKVTWSQLCSKFLLKNYQPHWKQHFERSPRVE